MKPTTNTPQSVPDVFTINGKNLVQIQSAPKSGYFKFKDVEDGEIHIFEKDEIPSHYWDKLNYGLSGLFGYESTPQSVQEESRYTKGELWRDDDGFIAIGHGDDYRTVFADLDCNDLDISEREANKDRLIECWNGYDKLKAENEGLKTLNKEGWEKYKINYNLVTELKAENKALKGYASYVESTISRGAVPRLTFQEWKEDGQPETK